MKLTESKLKQIIKEEVKKMEEVGLGFKRQSTEYEPRVQATNRPISHHEKYGMPPSDSQASGKAENDIRYYYSGTWHNLTSEEEYDVFEEWDPSSERFDDAVARVILDRHGIEIEDVER